jgi:hypothetical protein
MAAKIIARVSLKTIAAECGVDPKAARVTLRKSTFRKHDDNWSFAEAELDRVRTLLNPKKFPAAGTAKPKRTTRPRAAKAPAAPAPTTDA